MGAFLAIAAFFGIVGGICGIWSLIYVRQQTDMMARDISDRKKRDEEDDQWAQRFENLQRRLLRINPRVQVQEPGNTNTTWIYWTMYPEDKFRKNGIETFIVQIDAAENHFFPRKPQPHEFRSATMRETIDRAEREMEKFIKEHPFCKQHLLY